MNSSLNSSHRFSPSRVLANALFAGAALLLCMSSTKAPARTADEDRWPKEHLPFELPDDHCERRIRERCVVNYSRFLQESIGAAWRLDPGDIASETGVRRSDDYKADATILGENAELSDYVGSDYDRGHLAPAEDQGISKKTMSESFLLTNTVPQTHKLNGGQWQQLERQTRKWVKARKQLWVIAGLVFEQPIAVPVIGNGIVVPSHCWKIILDERPNGSYSAFGYVLPNIRTTTPKFSTETCTVDSIERGLGGWDFFQSLTDDEEAAFESIIVLQDRSGLLANATTGTATPLTPPATPAPVPDMLEPVERTSVYVARSGAKFHNQSCRYAVGGVSNTSRQEAKASGYQPCQVCKPGS